MKNFIITGVTISGNMGGTAMLETTLQQIKKDFSDSHFYLFSIYPNRDEAKNKYEGLEVISARPILLMGVYAPLAILFGWSSLFRRLLSAHVRFFSVLARADAVVDLSGIAFVDGRGLPLLWYNIANVFPAVAMKVPVFKLAQALGPFRTISNRVAARWILGACDAVVARGETSFRYLNELQINNTYCLPDVSFSLEISSEVHDRAKAIFNSSGIDFSKESIIVSPSRVVEQLCNSKGIDFLAELKAFVSEILHKRDVNVVILPHSFGVGASKNNDLEVARQLYAGINHPSVHLLIAEEDPALLRAIVGNAHFFVGCRFHAVVAALSMGVPTLVLGWSHKYREMADAFEAGVLCVDFSKFNAKTLWQNFEESWDIRDQMRSKLRSGGVRVRQLARENFDIVARSIGDEIENR